MTTNTEIELNDSINSKPDITPELLGRAEPAKVEDKVDEALPALALEDLEAIAGEEDDRDDKGRFVPRARLDELTAKRRDAEDRLTAAEEKLSRMEAEREAREAAEREATEKAQKSRDFDADRDALQEKFDSNEIEQADFRRQMRELDKEEREQIRRLAVAEAIEQIDKRNTEAAKRQHEQTIERASADLKEAAERFLAEPENAPYKTDQFRIAAFNVAKEEVWAEKAGNIGWDELLEEARERVEKYFAPHAKTADETPAERVARERREQEQKAAATVRDIPGRPNGGMGSRALQGRDDENLEMSRNEYANLPQAERDRLLGKVA